MAYSEELAERIRVVLEGHPLVVEKKMFGGVGFLLQGNMACGVHRNDLVVRVGPDGHEQALDEPHTRVFNITGRPMTGWVLVSPKGCASEEDLSRWVLRGMDFAGSLPVK